MTHIFLSYPPLALLRLVMEAAHKFIDLVEAATQAGKLSASLPADLSADDVTKLIQQVVAITPTCYNCQGSRVIILYGEEHTRFWQRLMKLKVDTAEERRFLEESVVPAAGTVVLLEDDLSVKVMQKMYPSFAMAFPYFAEHSSGMVELSLTVGLAQKEIGTIIRHYRTDPAEVLEADSDVPETWKMKAQIAFGLKTAPSMRREELPDSHCFILSKK